MKKFTYISIMLAVFVPTAYSQLDTIGKYPYLYHYNWPETGVVQSDSVYCNVYLSLDGGIIGSGDDLAWWVDYLDSIGGRVCEYAVYQHTDTPLTVIGLAIGNQVNMSSLYKSLRLYDSTMTEIASVRGIFSSGIRDSLQADTNVHHFYFPGIATIVNPTPTVQASESIITYIYYAFFDKEVEVSGDYYIGFQYETSACSWMDPNYMAELHGAPYHFASNFRYRVDTIWSPIRTSRYVPTLFAILKFPCEPVDSVSVVLGSDGCLTVDWEAPELQSSWTVSLTLPDGSEIVQPTDTNHWEYCGLAPGAYYRVKVRSRCDDIDGHSWSDWSREFSVGNPQAIAETALPTLEVHPNPTDGTVLIPAEGIREVWCVAADGRRTRLEVKDSQVSLKEYPAGLYVLEIQTAEGLYSAKVVKR